MADPLSVGASVVGLIAAGGRLIDIIHRMTHASETLKEIQAELTTLRPVLSGLESFIEQTQSISSTRTILIPVQDVIAIFTQIVLVHTELEAFVQTRSNGISLGDRTRDALQRGDTGASRLLSQLQRHKMNLSILLQIIQWYEGQIKRI